MQNKILCVLSQPVHRTATYTCDDTRCFIIQFWPPDDEHIYLLTPWCRVLLEKLTGLQLVKKFPAFDGTRRFITALTSVRHLSLSCASPIQSTYPHPTSWRSIEERPPIWRVAANKLNKQSWKLTRGGPSAWGLGEVLTTPPCKTFMLRNTCRQDDGHIVLEACRGV